MSLSEQSGKDGLLTGKRLYDRGVHFANGHVDNLGVHHPIYIDMVDMSCGRDLTGVFHPPLRRRGGQPAADPKRISQEVL